MSGKRSDRKLVLWLFGGVLLLIVLVSVLAPKSADADPRPAMDNASAAGVKAAYLALGQLGYRVEKMDVPADELAQRDASRDTLLLLEPRVREKTRKATAAAVQEFVRRGGRVLATGESGAELLPGGRTTAPGGMHHGLCYTTPQGQGALARAGEVSMLDESAWDERDVKLGTALHVEQRCGDDAVVVRYAFGAGEVVWWSSSAPMSNAGLKEDAALKLVLASVGAPGRTLLFDEYLHGTEAGEDAVGGLPLKWVLMQLGLVAGLVVFSFSRRRGPVRLPVVLPRSSPVEFAESMGHLYDRAGATSAATGMARLRLLRFLQAECGVDRAALQEGPVAISEVLTARFGGEWHELREHLEEAEEAEQGELQRGSALRLVLALRRDEQRLRELLSPKSAAEGSGLKEARLLNRAKESM